jgi:hypothetical protein
VAAPASSAAGDKLSQRAARFGTGVTAAPVTAGAAEPTSTAASDELAEKIRQRAAKFNIPVKAVQEPVQKKKQEGNNNQNKNKNANKPAVVVSQDPEVLEKLKKRAERFQIPEKAAVAATTATSNAEEVLQIYT